VVGAAGAVKDAFTQNQTLGAIGSGVSAIGRGIANRRAQRMNKGITSEKSMNLNATAPKGSFEHSGGFGNRMRLESVNTDNPDAKQSKTAPEPKRNWSADSVMARFEKLDSSPYSVESEGDNGSIPKAPPLPRQMPRSADRFR
jgi:hypothetical protein